MCSILSQFAAVIPSRDTRRGPRINPFETSELTCQGCMYHKAPHAVNFNPREHVKMLDGDLNSQLGYEVSWFFILWHYLLGEGKRFFAPGLYMAATCCYALLKE